MFFLSLDLVRDLTHKDVSLRGVWTSWYGVKGVLGVRRVRGVFLFPGEILGDNALFCFVGEEQQGTGGVFDGNIACNARPQRHEGRGSACELESSVDREVVGYEHGPEYACFAVA